MQALVETIVDDPAVENVNALYAHCLAAPSSELVENRVLLHRLQYSIWGSDFSRVYKPEGLSYSPSMMNFALCANTFTKEELHADTRTMADFPLVEIQSVWKHDVDDCGQIRCMSLQLVCHTLEGAEWNLFSDLMFGAKKRTALWLTQVTELIRLLRMRVYDFVQEPSTREILNVPDYVDTSRLLPPVDRAETGDCDSDPEVGRLKRARVVEIPEEGVPVRAAVNSDFLFDMDTYFSSIAMRLRQHQNQGALQDPPKVDLVSLRAWMLGEIRTVDPRHVVGAREDWHLRLICSDCYMRIENRKSWLGTTGIKQVIYKRNYDLPETMPRKIAEITTPAVINRVENMRLNMDALLVHLGVPHNNLCRAVFVSGVPDEPEDLSIYFLPISGVWVCHVSAEVRFRCTSFLHAFVVLRTVSRAQGLPHMVRGVDTSKFDPHIFKE